MKKLFKSLSNECSSCESRTLRQLDLTKLCFRPTLIGLNSCFFPVTFPFKGTTRDVIESIPTQQFNHHNIPLTTKLRNKVYPLFWAINLYDLSSQRIARSLLFKENNINVKKQVYTVMNFDCIDSFNIYDHRMHVVALFFPSFSTTSWCDLVENKTDNNRKQKIMDCLSR